MLFLELLNLMLIWCHADNAEFALATCPFEPYVLCGGKDKLVVLWSIQDHISTLVRDLTDPNPSGPIVKNSDNASLGPRGIFQGHTDTVEDVQFCPTSTQEFCSVGDDSCLIIWDSRVGTDPIMKDGTYLEVSGSPTKKAILQWSVKIGMDFDAVRSQSYMSLLLTLQRNKVA